MCASWNKKFNPNLISNKFEQIKTMDEGTRKASFRGFEYEDYFSVLCTIADLDKNIHEIDKHRIINESIFSVGGKGKITARKLLNTINKLEKIYLSRGTKQYILVTSLSLEKNSLISKSKINSGHITFTPQLPATFHRARELTWSRSARHTIDNIPQKYLFARIHVIAKSAFEATGKAFANLDLIRGIWNLGLNRKRYLSISYGGKQRPINRIILGPFHTLHEPGGKLSTDTFWFDPHFNNSVQPYQFDNQDEKDYVISFAKLVRKKLRTIAYSDDICEGIIRYTRALDYSDYDIAFLKLWSVLEFLTNTLKAKYDNTIKRTAFCFKEYDFHCQVLNHLRDYRNKSVHTGSSDNSGVKIYIYQLKRYVEELLIFHLSTKMKFSNIESASEFLDLSQDAEFLREKCQLYQKAIKFLSD